MPVRASRRKRAELFSPSHPFRPTWPIQPAARVLQQLRVLPGWAAMRRGTVDVKFLSIPR